MRRYTIQSVRKAPPLAGDVACTPWAGARVLRIDRYPWYAGGERQSTAVRMLYGRRALYVQFRCRDRHISAVETKRNGDVYLDSCVELFAMPQPAPGAGYFNLEVNCCGCMHLGWGPGRAGRRLVTRQLASRIAVATSIATPTKAELPDDRAWWVAAAIPFATLSEFAGRSVRPVCGDVWRANLYRCGGETDPQYAVWNPIDWPQPDYHRPEFFGELRFA